MLDELDWTETRAGAKPPRRSREGFPHSVVAGLEEEHLGVATALAPQAQPRGQHARVVDDHERLAELSGQVAERSVPDRTGSALEDEQLRFVATLERMLRDQLGRKVVVELSRPHPIPSDPKVRVAAVDRDALERARKRLTSVRAAAPIRRPSRLH